MLRRSHGLTAVAVLAMCIVPGFAYGMTGQPVAPQSSQAQPYQDLRSPDAKDAKTEPVAQVAQDLHSPDAKDASTDSVTQVAQDLRSPDAKDAAGNYVEPSPREFADSFGDLRSPDARDAARLAKVEVAQDLRSPDARDAGLPESPTPDTVVEIREVPGNGFDWGAAGIGAAGILALLSITGLALMVTTRRRRGGSEMPAH